MLLGWFHAGDAAVVHPDGYVEIRDRLKDVIISGGENISSVEVEGVVLRHRGSIVDFAVLISDQSAIYPGESYVKIFKLLLRATISVRWSGEMH